MIIPGQSQCQRGECCVLVWAVATNYNRREGETWTSDPQWHRITGRIGQSKYKVEGQTHYSVDLIADSFAILAKAKVKTVGGDMQD